jgi:hypothetical protein
MHFWHLLNRTQHSIGNFTGCFHNEHTSAMIWYLTETLSLLPKFNYIFIISRIQFGYVRLISVVVTVNSVKECAVINSSILVCGFVG